MKEIHFYEYNDTREELDMIHSWNDTMEAIGISKVNINTTQMGLLSTDLFSLGYKIFVHESSEESYEIVLGDDNTRTNRTIRVAHNLFKMWRANEFVK